MPFLDPSNLGLLAHKRILFGHRSVGDDILAGVADLTNALELVRLDPDDPHPPPNDLPFFAHCYIGENGKPQAKNEDFARLLHGGLGDVLDIAMFKYCFADVDADTSPFALFERYSQTLSKLQARYPAITFVHITIPLTVPASGLRSSIKKLLGRPTETSLNATRNAYNQLLRTAYPFALFDLAAIESTDPDGTRCYLRHRGADVEVLSPTLTTDGGHLNGTGARLAAAGLLQTLISMLQKKGDPHACKSQRAR